VFWFWFLSFSFPSLFVLGSFATPQQEAQKLSIAFWPSGYEPMTKAYKPGAYALRNTIKVNSAISIYQHVDTFKIINISVAMMLRQRLSDYLLILQGSYM
jgi:hypothetical protein